MPDTASEKHRKKRGRRRLKNWRERTREQERLFTGAKSICRRIAQTDDLEQAKRLAAAVVKLDG